MEAHLRIRRMEQPQHEQLPDGRWHYHMEVVEHTKSDAGCRTIYVVSTALELFDSLQSIIVSIIWPARNKMQTSRIHIHRHIITYSH